MTLAKEWEVIKELHRWKNEQGIHNIRGVPQLVVENTQESLLSLENNQDFLLKAVFVGAYGTYYLLTTNLCQKIIAS